MVALEDPVNARWKKRLWIKMLEDLAERGVEVEPEKLEMFEKDYMADYLSNARLKVGWISLSLLVSTK